MGNADGLTLAQRVRRRIALLGGSYTHPDGQIELDFDEPAGIDIRNDSDEVQQAKLAAYERRKRADNQQVAMFVFGFLAGATLMHYWPSLWPF
ncbi:hypothetical protein [Methylocystis sp.]|uniref:hypothetical protein n=1 Tax=Methylocystis sp. TaxID=1911079 RepID=UPI003D0C06E8